MMAINELTGVQNWGRRVCEVSANISAVHIWRWSSPDNCKRL